MLPVFPRSEHLGPRVHHGHCRGLRRRCPTLRPDRRHASPSASSVLPGLFGGRPPDQARELPAHRRPTHSSHPDSGPAPALHRLPPHPLASPHLLPAVSPLRHRDDPDRPLRPSRSPRLLDPDRPTFPARRSADAHDLSGVGRRLRPGQHALPAGVAPASGDLGVAFECD